MGACVQANSDTGALFLQAPTPADQCQGYILLQRDEYNHFQSLYYFMTSEFSYSSAISSFLFFFSTVLFFYQISKASGIILSFIRKAF